MQTLTWNDSYSTGLTELDDDHRQLLDIINNFNAARETGRGIEVLGGTLRAVKTYAADHFKHEEGLMARYKYPKLAEHAAQHRKSMELINGFIAQQDTVNPSAMVDRVAHFLRFWFANHFIGEDSKFKRFLFEQGIGDTASSHDGLFDRLTAGLRLRSRIVFAVIIPMIALVGVSVGQITDHVSTMRNMEALGTLSTAAPDISNLVHELQKERGASAGFIGSRGAKFSARLKEQRTHTDAMFSAFGASMATLLATDTGKVLEKHITHARESLDQLSGKRQAITALELSVPQMAGYYTPTIDKLLHIIEEMGAVSTDAEVTDAITAYTSLLQGKERAGIERAMGAAGFSSGVFKPKIYNKFVSLIAQQNTYFDMFRHHASTAEGTALDAIMEKPAAIEVARLRTIALNSPQSGDMQGITGPQWFDSITRKINLLKGLEDTVASNLRHMTAEHAQEARNGLIAIVAVLATMIVLTVLFAALIVRSITGPLMAVTGKAVAIADGDLGTPVPAILRRDEIGQLARAVQHFKDNGLRIQALTDEQASSRVLAEKDQIQAMHDLAGTFQHSVGQVIQSVTSASTEMQASAESLSTTAEQTSNQSGVVSDAAEGASANVQTVAAAAEELSASISEISRQVAQSSGAAQAAAEDAADANTQVQGLAKAADTIGQVVSLISDIAEQTNLLALNATIEAARAGEAGKGFAVVANEVKSLAKQTATATEDIAKQVGAIQAETGNAVAAIQAIGKAIADISEVSTNVAAAMEQQEAATREIARNVEQAANGTEHVTANILGVREAAGETGTAAVQMLAAANELSHQAEILHSEVDTFLAEVKAA